MRNVNTETDKSMVDAAARGCLKACRALALVAALMSVLWLLGAPQFCLAGTMTRATLEPLFPAPLMVGDKNPALAAWALLKQASASRVMELAVLGLGLALLVVLLLRQRWVAANTGRLKWVRAAYLLFTLVFIGWVAQGQLTIVTLTSLIEALVAGQGLAFLLADPVTVLLWAFVVWALGCTLLSLFVFRGYCRYVCPLGAALSLFGRLRLFAWIPRRTECGTPCQSCRHRCDYQAIAPSGVVDYAECFQCLDCVEIYQDDRRCLPLVVERKQSGARHIRIQPVALS